MSTSGTRLMLPCAVSGARSARRCFDRWASEAMGASLYYPVGLAVAEADVGAVDEGVDETHRELVHLLDDRLRLPDEVRVRDGERDGGEQPEAGRVQGHRDTRRELGRPLGGRRAGHRGERLAQAV